MRDIVEVLECPRTHRPLVWASDRELVADDGGARYPVQDGVVRFLHGSAPPEADPTHSASVRDFYETAGWEADEHGQFGDTRAFLDTRNAPLAHTRKCLRRLRKYFTAGGQYLLDAGSGPIVHDELLAYGETFERRVCVDLSVQALRVARSKLGELGVCAQGDLTNLPIKSNSIDALACYHVIYQIPVEQQAAAFLELHRVLKPGGVGVIVYWWPEATLAWRVERVAQLIFGSVVRQEGSAAAPALERSDLTHNPLPRSWFESQDWPFAYRYDCFRIVSNDLMQRLVPDDWRGRLFLDALCALQAAAPSYCGRHGLMPAIIIEKR